MKHYAVIGNPVKHSLSPQIHQYFAQQCDIKLSYRKILSEKDAFKHAVRAFFVEGGNGLNVTVPFKNEAFLLADNHTERALIAGSANTLKKLTDGTLLADNTDGIGLVRDMIDNLNWQLAGKCLLILGAGGAVKGILPSLLAQNPQQILIANRTLEKAQQLAQHFKDKGELCGFALTAIKNKPVDIIINATTTSLANEALVLPDKLSNNALCYDLFYGKKTLFMQWAETHYAQQISDGLGMLVEQAAASFYLWHDVNVSSKSLIGQLRQENSAIN